MTNDARRPQPEPTRGGSALAPATTADRPAPRASRAHGPHAAPRARRPAPGSNRGPGRTAAASAKVGLSIGSTLSRRTVRSLTPRWPTAAVWATSAGRRSVGHLQEVPGVNLAARASGSLSRSVRPSRPGVTNSSARSGSLRRRSSYRATTTLHASCGASVFCDAYTEEPAAEIAPSVRAPPPTHAAASARLLPRSAVFAAIKAAIRSGGKGLVTA